MKTHTFLRDSVTNNKFDFQHLFSDFMDIPYLSRQNVMLMCHSS